MGGSPLIWRSGTLPVRHPARMFLPLLRSAVAAQPGRLDLLRDLVVALRDDRRWTEIVDLLTPLGRSGGLNPELAFELGSAALALDDPTTALAAFDRAIAGGIVNAHRQRAYALEALGREDEARAAARTALHENPHDAKALELVAKDMVLRGEAGALTALCQDLASCGVQSTTLLAFRAMEAGLAGRHAELDALLEPGRWCAWIQLEPGLVDNERLADAILSHPALAPSPAEKPTHGRNLRLEKLASRSEPAIRNFLAVVRQQVDAYVARRIGSPHPLMAQRPDTVRLDGWALVLSEDGRELHHIHPDGWLTAVYYVRTPKAEGDGKPPPGSIVFGPWPPACDHVLPAFPRWHFEPQAGMLLIFPSFMGHHTIPTSVAGARICVALDVVPRQPFPETR